MPSDSGAPPASASFAKGETGNNASSIEEGNGGKDDPAVNTKIPLENHVFQTIFLDKAESSTLWSKGEIAPGKASSLLLNASRNIHAGTGHHGKVVEAAES